MVDDTTIKQWAKMNESEFTEQYFQEYSPPQQVPRSLGRGVMLAWGWGRRPRPSKKSKMAFFASMKEKAKREIEKNLQQAKEKVCVELQYCKFVKKHKKKITIPAVVIDGIVGLSLGVPGPAMIAYALIKEGFFDSICEC